MSLSDFFKKKKEDVKEDNVDLLEDLFDEPIKYIPNKDSTLEEENELLNKAYEISKGLIKDLEKENEALKKINELSEKEIELLNEVNEVLEKMNELSEGKIVRLDKENKELRYIIRDFKMRR